MGNNNDWKNTDKNRTDVLDKIKNINEITKKFIFIDKTELFLEFSFKNSKIKVIIMDYYKQLGVFDTNKRTKYIEIKKFYQYFNTLMNSLNIFYGEIIQERISKLNDEERENYSMDGEGLCPLCLDKKVNFSLPCSHFFCEDCIKLWMLKSETCPLCRIKLKCNKKTPDGIVGSERWTVFDSKIDQNQMNQYNEEIFMDLTNNLFKK